MEKQPVSIGTQMFLGKIVIGCLWISYSIIGMIDNIVCDIVSISALVSGIVVLVVLMRLDLEEDDEMSHHNYIQAKAKTTDVMHIIFCIFSIGSALALGLLNKAGIEYYRWVPRFFFMLIGIQNLITGLIFRKLEKE